MNKEILQIKINKKITLAIQPVSKNTDMGDKIYAINWFNTQRSWLYKTYTTLATPMVIKVGARLIYKGKFQEYILGDKSLGRDILMIVQYPNAEAFLDLLSYKFFQIISLLRQKAVKRFVFGFTKPLTKKSTLKPQSLGALSLVHHFTLHTNQSIDTLDLQNYAQAHNTRLIFVGQKAAKLNRTDDTQKTVSVPFIMDGIMIAEAVDKTALLNFYKSDFFQTHLSNFQDNYVALFKKIG